MNLALYAKKSVSGGQIFRSFLVKSSWMCTSHISFPEFSLATIFFMSGEYLVDHSGFFDLVWVVLCGTHISLFNSVSLCNVVRRDVFGAKTSSHIGFPEFFLPPISIFFKFWNILDFPSFFLSWLAEKKQFT